jgi:hypothetical protein
MPLKMRKTIFILLLVLTSASLIAFTNTFSVLNQYRLLIGICLITFGGFLRHHVVCYNKTRKE